MGTAAALAQHLPSASFLELEVVSSQVPAGPPAVATPECTAVPSPPPPHVWHRAWHSMLCLFPTLCLRSRRCFHQNLKMAVDPDCSPAGAGEAGEGSGPSK